MKNLYRNKAWYAYAEKVKERDKYTCQKPDCKRDKDEVVLQVHHISYKEGLLPHQYPLSECITLCRGCHAREHGLIQPNSGWLLIGIDDHGKHNREGTCYRAVGKDAKRQDKDEDGKRICGRKLRFDHHAYHAKWGYEVFGSKCIDHLTEPDRAISDKVLTFSKMKDDFLEKKKWKDWVDDEDETYREVRIKDFGLIYIINSKGELGFELYLKGEKKGRYTVKPLVTPTPNDFKTVSLLAYIAMIATKATEDEKIFYRADYLETLKNWASKQKAISATNT